MNVERIKGKEASLVWLPGPIIELLEQKAGRCEANREVLVKLAQEAMGLKADGWPGSKTILGLVGSSSPIPKNRRQLASAIGNPKWSPDRGRSVDLDDDWEDKNIRRFTMHDGRRRSFHADYGDEWVKLFELAVKCSGYQPKSVQTWNPRRIGGTQRLSMHAYGIAFDVDPSSNPWGGSVKGEPSLLRRHPMFVQVFEMAGWTWGGRWRKGKGDDMHFQRCGV